MATRAIPPAESLSGEEADDADEFELASLRPDPIVLRLSEDAMGERLDKAVARLVSQYSRSRIRQWMDAGFVTVDGHPARAKDTMLGDEEIVILPQAAPEDEAFKPQPMDLSVVHEDSAIIVIDKPAGLVVHPAAGNWTGTLLNGLLHRFPSISAVPRAGIVHRLDKETSGLMVVAKTLEAHTSLVRQLQARSVKREYVALAWGTLQVSGKVDAAIARHARDRVKMAVSESIVAKPAVTHYQRLASGALDGRPVSLVRCRLETGRTHQIRVHMQSIGHPLVGDSLYGKAHLVSVFPRQALHAQRLGLIHPGSGQLCEWSVELPPDMQQLLARAGIAIPE